MKKMLAVGIGGALGTLLRYAMYQIPLPFGVSAHSAATLAINITGSFFLGMLTILFIRKIRVTAEMRLAVTTGVMGGYTTFSTMSKDAVSLVRAGLVLPAAGYLALSVGLGLAAAWCGILVGKRLEGRKSA